MVIGKLSLRLMIPGAHSLKDKRRALRSIKDRLASRYNVSIAEVDAQDVWQTAVLAVCAVGSERAYVQGLLEKVITLVQSNRHVVLGRCDMEFV